MSTSKPAWQWFWLSIAVIALDQFSKLWIRHVLQPGQMHAVIPRVLYGTLTYNTGAAFSFLAGADGWQRWFFIVLAIAIVVALSVWLLRTPRGEWRVAMPLALIIGGAVGNLIDRIFMGQVTDFILVYIGRWAYPAFNVADSAITVGAVLLIAFSLFGGKRGGDMR